MPDLEFQQAAAALLREAFPPDVLQQLLQSRCSSSTGSQEEQQQDAHAQLIRAILPSDDLVMGVMQSRGCQYNQTRDETASEEATEASSVGPVIGGGCGHLQDERAQFAQRLDLSYRAQDKEERFCCWYSDVLSSSDVMSSVAYIVLAMTAYTMVAANCSATFGWRAALLHVLPLMTGVLVLGMLLPVLQRAAPAFTAAHREGIVAAIRVVTVVHILAHRHLTPAFHAAPLPLIATVNSSGLLPLVSPALRLRVRLRVHLRLHTLLAALCAVSNALAPISCGASTAASASSSLQHCTLMMALATLAYVVPTAIAYVLEKHARTAFERAVASPPPPAPGGKAAAVAAYDSGSAAVGCGSGAPCGSSGDALCAKKSA